MMKAIRVATMLLALVGSTYAGEVLTPPAPQPTQANTAQEPATGGEIPNGDMPNDATESLTVIALDLLSI